jgi:hypothetical protein
MRTDTENEVIALLTEAGYWDDKAVWRHIGDNDSNWSTIGNQQGDPIAALAEKLINAIDAVLTNLCYESGIDPKGSGVPTSIREAVARFVERAPNPKADHAGRVSEWLDPKIREVAHQLTLAATGADGRQPSLSIADVGEGQTPDGIPDTFMSLNRRNKVDIPFVQGKYNMGGTGALYFCGSRKLQLVVTRRNPRLVSGSGRDGEWGFTVTRREPTGARSSVFTYLAPIGADTHPRGGRVLSFPRGSMPILPEASKGVRGAYEREVAHGSLIKLYEYDSVPRQSIVFTRRGLRQRIETFLPELALPMGVFECRKFRRGVEGGSYFTPARGVATRLSQEKSETQLEFPPLGGVLSLDGADIIVKVYAFRRVPGRSKRDGFLADYAQGAGVLYTVNGQTHHRVRKEFFTRGAVGLDYLKDDLLVTVDCTGVDEITREDLFMNSRDRNRVTPRWRQLEKMVERFLKYNPELKELSIRRREETIRERLEDDQALADLLGRVLESSPDLARILLGGARLPAPFPRQGTGSRSKASKFVGKPFPTYFHFDKHKPGEEHKRTAEVGRELRVTFVTDAQDDYFWRDTDRGYMRVLLSKDGVTEEVDGTALTLRSGVARWIGHLPAGASTGDTLTYDFEVTDALRDEPFRNRLVVDLQPASERPSSPSKRRKEQNEGEGDDEGQSGVDLPEVTPVKRGHPAWDEFDFDDSSALAVRRQPGEGHASGAYDFFYNVENESLLREQKADPQDAELIRERFRCALVLVGLALLRQDTHGMRTLTKDGDVSIEDVVASTTRALAPILLPLVSIVGTLSAAPEDI